MAALSAQRIKLPYQRHRLAWLNTARPEQLPPNGQDWLTWLVCAGRGFGKTRAGAEWLSDQMTTTQGTRWAIVAPTFADCRDTCVEGESGLLFCLGDEPYEWHRSIGELYLPRNDVRAKCFAAEEPNRLRGPQHHGAWCDEVSSWRYDEAWDQLLFGLRLGARPLICATTTPKPNTLTKQIMSDPDTIITRGSTFDNKDHLAATALKKLREKYAGTRLGRQELNAEMLDDVPGALWPRHLIESCRVRRGPTGGYKRLVVGVDPSGSSGTKPNKSKKLEGNSLGTNLGNYQGIIAAGLGMDDVVYIISDDSLQDSPGEWGKRVVDVYTDLEADAVVAEVNYGGEMVKHVVQTAAAEQETFCNVKMVTATRGKALRAEPVAALYEQGRVRHIGAFPDLEDQMANITPKEWLGAGSPDRLDAMVWAVTDLLLGTGFGKVHKVTFG